jgi:mRNA interferase HigB
MNIFNKSSLNSFWEKHAETKTELLKWYHHTSKQNWKGPLDVKKSYVTASIIANNRVVFNIRGNAYRLIVEFSYGRGSGFVKFIGTHREYDKIDAAKVNQYPPSRKGH